MAEKQENPFLSLVLNIVIPSFILMKLSSADTLGPLNGLLIALSFPLLYGVYDFYDRKKVNFISILGLISILLTGVFTIVKLPSHWIAVKEAAIPAVIGCSIIFSMKTKFPLVKKLLFNENIMNVELVTESLSARGNGLEFEVLLNKTSYLLASSFFVSSVLNFVLAKTILISEPGSEAFNAELGQMTALSWPVIVLPSMIIMFFALFQLIRGIKRLTGLELDQVLQNQAQK